jgi:hypothetical protein
LVNLEAFLAAQSAGYYGCDPIEMCALALHCPVLPPETKAAKSASEDSSMFSTAIALITG